MKTMKKLLVIACFILSVISCLSCTNQHKNARVEEGTVKWQKVSTPKEKTSGYIKVEAPNKSVLVIPLAETRFFKKGDQVIVSLKETTPTICTNCIKVMGEQEQVVCKVTEVFKK